MKKILLLMLVLVFMLVLSRCEPRPVIEDCMAIEFDGSSGIVTFGANSAIDDLDDKTIIVMFESGGSGENNTPRILDKVSGGNAGWLLLLRDDTNRVDFQQYFTDNQGIWQTDTSSYTDDELLHFALSYNRTSTGNNPVFYGNGVSISVNETLEPSGTQTNDNGQALQVGNRAADDRTLDGIVYKILIYNRILTATEIKEDYDSKMFITNFNGLVWACAFHGAGGLQTYEGASLAAGNTFREYINGDIGTPANTPTGVGDTVLHNGHLQWQEGRGGS